jgi:hypothetical protein
MLIARKCFRLLGLSGRVLVFYAFTRRGGYGEHGDALRDVGRFLHPEWHPPESDERKGGRVHIGPAASTR